MQYKHTSVLFSETIEHLNINPEGIYVDGTLGGGGHAKGICKELNSKGIFIGIDRDQDAIRTSKEILKKYSCEKHFIQENYEDIIEILKKKDIEGIDGAVLDLGVSSFQLDNPERGFSYMNDGPLDMRMNTEDTLTAYEIVNTYKKQQLEEVIKLYGEERWASRISEFIVTAREKESIKTTFQLVDLIKAAVPASARRDGPHPAKRTFQAIRIEVNDELGQLERSVERFVDVLNYRGRLCVITFHSLEDRIVKRIFQKREKPCICPKDFPYCTCGKLPDVIRINHKPIRPKKQEIDENTRARSAKLRVIEKR